MLPFFLRALTSFSAHVTHVRLFGVDIECCTTFVTLQGSFVSHVRYACVKPAVCNELDQMMQSRQQISHKKIRRWRRRESRHFKRVSSACHRFQGNGRHLVLRTINFFSGPKNFSLPLTLRTLFVLGCFAIKASFKVP